ncbi:HK97 gp10 family phage protein [Clostridium perfringens]|uniref:HK97 gp10 family phage protein n=1 Tax=Clostridium perfringens TaxID=1502 RepID=UPI001240B5FF|nr:HK97 gp10 family phage protein [Clostridium perfringens]
MVKVENKIKENKELFLQAIKDATRECKITGIADIQNVTPVKTGALKRSIAGEDTATEENVKLQFGSSLIYAKKVEFENKSYIRATLTRDIPKFEKIFIKYLRKACK